MRKNIILSASFVVSFFVFSGTGFGDESPHGSIFNEYINSPEGSSEAPVDKNASQNQVMDNEVREKPEKADTKKSLQGIPAKDQVCTMDSDCTAGVVDCVSWGPFNKKYLHELFKESNSCPASIDPGFQPVTVCAAKVCKAAEKTTGVSWDDWLRER